MANTCSDPVVAWLRWAPHAVLGAFCAGLVVPLALAPPLAPVAAGCAAAGAAAALAAARGRAGAALGLLVATALLAGLAWGQVRVAQTAAPDLDLPAQVSGVVVVDAPPVPDGRGGLRARAVVEALHGDIRVASGVRLLLDLSAADGPVPVGTRLRLSGRMRAAAAPDAPGWWRAWLGRQGIAARMRPDTSTAVGRRGGLRGLRDRWREWAGREAGAGLSGDRAVLVRGMALGGGAGLSQEAADAFRDAGIWHLLAVSGQNVTVVAMATLALLSAVGVRRRPAVAAAAGVMVAYCLACDGGASVGRAGIVGALELAAELRSAPRERWYLMLAGLALLLAHQPRAIADPGLQLSFAAVCGLFTLAPPLAEWWRGWVPGPVADLAAMAGAAGLATAPVVVWHFGRLSLVGLALNVVAVPLAAPIVVLALAGIGVGALVPAAGVALAWVAGLGAGIVLVLARLAAAVPGAALDLPGLAAPALAVLALAVLAAFRLLRPDAPWTPRRPSPRLATAVAAALVAVWVLSRPGPPPPWPAVAMVTALDVGQGDAILLRSPDGAAALVDSGPPGSPSPVVPALRRLGVRRLSAIVLTHDSLDHVGGASDALSRMPVGVLMMPPAPVDGWAPPAQAVIAVARERGVPLATVRAGSRFAVGTWSVGVLSPAGARPAGADPNPYSLVALARAGTLDVLLTADAESDALARLPAGPVDVLKVSHHGSADPGLAAELARRRPRAALISAGEDNAYRHPRPDTLATLAAAGVAAWRTDLAGDLSAVADGDGVAVSGSR